MDYLFDYPCEVSDLLNICYTTKVGVGINICWICAPQPKQAEL